MTLLVMNLSKERNEQMKEYLVSREKLKEMLEADEKEKGYYTKR